MEEEKNIEIENKKVLTANQMIGELLLSLTIYGLIFYIVYYIAINLIKNSIGNNYVLLALTIVVLQAIIAFLIFTLSNKKAFKKGTIYKNDVSKIISNISIVIIILVVILGLGTFANVESAMNETIENNFGLQYREKLLSYIYDEDEMAIYNSEKEKAIKEAKQQVYSFTASVEIGICAVYTSAIFLEKKFLYEKAI